MKSSICTLFDGNYHYGALGLINSLIANKFEGNIYAGTRNDIPFWCRGLHEIKTDDLSYDCFRIQDNILIYIVKLQTQNHLTNYKPNFMLELMESFPSEFDTLYYFDPDIVVAEHWSYFEDALSCGVVLCEDVNSPVSEYHPRRIGWRRYFEKFGFQLNFKSPCYINGGCVGVSMEDISFLHTWKALQESMFEEIGGGQISSLTGGEEFAASSGFAGCFSKTDQDALNATMEAYGGQVSIFGQEAMAFKPGLAILPHAIGTRKPWSTRYLTEALRGFPPRKIDSMYWKYVDGPIKAHSGPKVWIQRRTLQLAKIIGRSYRRPM